MKTIFHVEFEYTHHIVKDKVHTHTEYEYLWEEFEIKDAGPLFGAYPVFCRYHNQNKDQRQIQKIELLEVPADYQCQKGRQHSEKYSQSRKYRENPMMSPKDFIHPDPEYNTEKYKKERWNYCLDLDYFFPSDVYSEYKESRKQIMEDNLIRAGIFDERHIEYRIKDYWKVENFGKAKALAEAIKAGKPTSESDSE